ncbi:MAG: hypothetical protein AB7E41_12160 [Mycolicibacterium sp.]
MPIDRLRSFADASGPFVSLYVDDTRDNPDAEKRATIRWQAIRRNLEDSGAAEHMIGAVERALLHSQPGVGRGGRAVIAGREGVLLNDHLGAPPSITVLRVSEYPYVLPLLDLTTSNPPYVFAAVDHLGADLTGHRNGLVHRETVEGHGYPVHKPVSAGWQGYDDHERSAEEAVRMNARAVADRITDLVDRGGGELVFLSGEVRARTDVVAALPQRITDRVVTLPAGARGRRATERELADEIDAEFARRQRDGANTALARFKAESARNTGLAVEGLPDVCTALRAGSVGALIVGDMGSATVVCGQSRTTIAPDADTLSELGEAPSGVVLADEAVPFLAISTDATVVRAGDGAQLTDGIAAVLRYPLRVA